MKVRYADKPESVAWSSQLNMGGLGEVIVWFDDGSADSEYSSALEVYLETQDRWISLNEAFRRHDLITDDRGSRFFEPPTDEDRERGYALA